MIIIVTAYTLYCCVFLDKTNGKAQKELQELTGI